MGVTGKRIVGQRFVIDRGDSKYPRPFLNLKKPPGRLYCVGDICALQEGLAIIGARKATPYGLGCAGRFAKIAASKGIAIISGGAIGCDAAAHKAALEAGGRTVVFLGGGCDRIYPSQNFQLFQRIVDSGGLLVSENAWDFDPRPYTFRARNRLIASLAKATLIVEAGLPSGTFSTADEALSANREVLVIPGAITSRSSLGANRLIYQGATPIVDEDSFEDQLMSIYSVLRAPVASSDGLLVDSMAYGLTERQSDIFSVLSSQPLLPEELFCVMGSEGGDADGVNSEPCSGSGVGAMMSDIATLQCKGLIDQYPDGRFAVRVATQST